MRLRFIDPAMLAAGHKALSVGGHLHPQPPRKRSPTVRHWPRPALGPTAAQNYGNSGYFPGRLFAPLSIGAAPLRGTGVGDAGGLPRRIEEAQIAISRAAASLKTGIPYKNN